MITSKHNLTTRVTVTGKYYFMWMEIGRTKKKIKPMNFTSEMKFSINVEN